MTVQVVYDDSQTAHAGHLPEQLHGVGPVKVVQEKRGVGHVEGIVGIGKVQGVRDFDADMGTEIGREMGIKPGTPVSHGGRIEVHPHRLDGRPQSATAARQSRRVVAAPRAYVQHA